MGAASNPARICPECGTRNSGLSLFCAECGASLTNATSVLADDSQTTTTFRPASETAASDLYATQQFTPHSTFGNTSTSTYPAIDVAEDDPPGMAHTYSPEPESRRGLVLGWIAAIMILLVIAWLGWTSFLDADTRDSIMGLFGA